MCNCLSTHLKFSRFIEKKKIKLSYLNDDIAFEIFFNPISQENDTPTLVYREGRERGISPSFTIKIVSSKLQQR